VDFDCPDPELNGKVHAPFLGTPLREALASNALSLVAHGSGYAVAYGEHLFPIRPDDEEEIAKAGIAAYRDATVLGGLIQRQNFVLDWWRNAGDRINWRRFFDITQLAAVRMEEPAAFAAKHAVALRLYREGLIDGLRIDHVDGLADPAGYCLELRRQLDDLQRQRPQELSHERAWLIVEKILAPGESIPAGWDVDGSTGYDFMDQVSAFQHQCAAAPELAANWAAISGRLRDFHGEEEIAPGGSGRRTSRWRGLDARGPTESCHQPYCPIAGLSKLCDRSGRRRSGWPAFRGRSESGPGLTAQ
jgi:(1->4)-alpha-D-glucan 1-alpha-D-glucosylmutase